MNKAQIIQNRITNLIKPFAGKWVTLSKDKTRILGVSRSVDSALTQAQKEGEAHPHLIKVPDATTAAYIY